MSCYTLKGVLLASGVVISKALAAEIATLNEEDEGEERRHIIPPKELHEHLLQWAKMPDQTQKLGNLPASAPPKVSHPGTGIQWGERGRRLDEPRDPGQASRATGEVNSSAYKTTGNIPSLTVIAPESKREASGSFHPEKMDDFLSEISQWSSETS